MTHEQAYERLAELVGLRAAPADEAALRDHVRACASCAERLASLQRVVGALDAVRDEPLPLPPGLEQRVLAIPADVDRGRRRGWRRRMVVGVPALAAAAAALVLALVAFSGPAEPTFTVERSVALRPAPASTAAGRVDVGRPTGQFRIMRVSVHGLPVAGDPSYDLWMMDGKGAMKAGTFGPDPDGACEVELMIPANERWTQLAITRSGGSPHGTVLAES